MKFALVSDSHGSLDRLDRLLENLQNNGITRVLHAGDLAADGIVEVLAKYPDLQIWIAIGNCDVNRERLEQLAALPNVERVAEVVQVRFDELRIAMSHIEGIAQRAGAVADIFCHGHTHREKVEMRDGHLICNPGALCEDGKFLLIDTKKPEITPRLFCDKIL